MHLMHRVTSTALLFRPSFCPPFSCLDTPRMIKRLRQCQPRCSGTARSSGAARFVRCLCQVVFIRARMRPICCLGCQPSPSSQQVLCAVLCVTVSARLVLREVADCFEFSQCSSTQLGLYTHPHICKVQVCTHALVCACWKALALTHTHTHLSCLKCCS